MYTRSWLPADAPEYAETFQRMKTKHRNFQEETGDPWVLKWEYE